MGRNFSIERGKKTAIVMNLRERRVRYENRDKMPELFEFHMTNDDIEINYDKLYLLYRVDGHLRRKVDQFHQQTLHRTT